MDRVTGSQPGHAPGPHALDDEPATVAFEAVPRPVAPRAPALRRAGLAVAAIAAVAIGAAVAAAAAERRAEPPGHAGEPTAAVTRSGSRPATLVTANVAPAGRITSAAGSGSARAVIALPGCEVTLQLGARQPRHVVDCPRQVPHGLGRMLVAAPGQALRFEVPGWRVPAADEVVTGPEGVGLATLTIRTCLSRGSDWLCATWYATLDVRD